MDLRHFSPGLGNYVFHHFTEFRSGFFTLFEKNDAAFDRSFQKRFGHPCESGKNSRRQNDCTYAHSETGNHAPFQSVIE
jgi:hypothetical protein